MTDHRDENDKLRDGDLPKDPFADGKRVKYSGPRLVGPNDKGLAQPADVPAEQALLGALLWSAANAPGTLTVTCVNDILIDGQTFFDRKHGDVYDAMLACTEQKQEHDPVAVMAKLVAAQADRRVGGLDGLRELMDNASTISEKQARVYAANIRLAWAKRSAIVDLRNLIEDARSPKVSAEEVYERAQQAAQLMSQRTVVSATTVSIGQSAMQLFTLLQTGTNTAISTGFRDIDEALNGGLRPAETSIIAARTSVGKSTLAANIGENMVTRDPTLIVLYVTLEMRHILFTARLLAARAGVTLSAIRRVSLNPNQWSAITQAVMDLKDKGLFFQDDPTQTLATILAMSRDVARRAKLVGKRLAMVVIDHVGLVKPSQKLLEKGTREQQVAETSRGMRLIGTELNCHVMGLAQIHRDAERQKGVEKMPKLHHLRESGALEQDADAIGILHRQRDESTGMLDKFKPAAFSVAKARMDETAIMLLDFDSKHVTFSDMNDPNKTFASEYGDA